MSSSYQQLKQLALEYLPLPKDAIHIYVGFLCLAVSVLLLRQELTSYRALLLGVLVSLGMEVLDLRDNRDYPQLMRWVGAARDLVNTNLIPVVVVLLARRRASRRKRADRGGGG